MSKARSDWMFCDPKADSPGIQQMRLWGLRPRRFRPRYALANLGHPVPIPIGFCYGTNSFAGLLVGTC